MEDDPSEDVRALAIKTVVALMLQSMPEAQSAAILNALQEAQDWLVQEAKTRPEQAMAVQDLHRRLSASLQKRALPS